MNCLCAHFGVYFPSWEVYREVNTNISLGWAHKQFITTIHTLFYFLHYSYVIMSVMASQITSLTIVYSTFYSSADQRKYQSSASLVFERGIHRSPVNSPHKWAVTRKMFPFDDVIMTWHDKTIHPLASCVTWSVYFILMTAQLIVYRWWWRHNWSWQLWCAHEQNDI